MRKGDLIRIRWIDADQAAGWSEHDDTTVTVIHTYGLYSKKDKYFLHYADTWLKKDKRWGGHGRIPIKTIIGMDVILASPSFVEELKIPEPKKK